jgi:hypothetical protein
MSKRIARILRKAVSKYEKSYSHPRTQSCHFFSASTPLVMRLIGSPAGRPYDAAQKDHSEADNHQESHVQTPY